MDDWSEEDIARPSRPFYGRFNTDIEPSAAALAASVRVP